MSQALVDQLIAAVAAEDVEVQKIIAYVKSVPGQIQNAVDAALAGGATAEQLSPLAAVIADIQAQTAAMAAVEPVAPPAP
jgi:hypothetical protein